MNRQERSGRWSFIIASASAVPYLYGVWREEFHPNVTSWVLWTLIGFVMLLSYKSTGAEENVWIGVVAFTNPLAITLLVLWKSPSWQKPDKFEIAATIVCLVALAIWILKHRDERFARIALATNILADMCAAAPTLRLAWHTPLYEQPIPWAMYCIAMVVAFFAVKKRTWDQYALPVYGLVIGLLVTIPTVTYRLLHEVPINRWW